MTPRRRRSLRGRVPLLPPPPPARPAGPAAKPAPAPRPQRAPVVAVLFADGRLDLYSDRDTVDLAVVRMPPIRETADFESMADELVERSVPLRHRGILYPRNRRQLHVRQCPPSAAALWQQAFLREVHDGLNALARELGTDAMG